jgi:hypothetical protein
MAHFAKLDANNVVIHVSVVDNSVLLDESGNEVEQLGVDYLSELHGHTNWKQTSYNGSIRKNYAGLGFTYMADIDAFVPPKVYDSWILDPEKGEWVAPVPKPDNEKNYSWDESKKSWYIDSKEQVYLDRLLDNLSQ